MTYKTWLKRLDACVGDAKRVTGAYYNKQITLTNFRLLWERAPEYNKKWVLYKLNAAEDAKLFKTAFPKGLKKVCAVRNCLICISNSEFEEMYKWENARAALIPFLRRTKALPLKKKR